MGAQRTDHASFAWITGSPYVYLYDRESGIAPFRWTRSGSAAFDEVVPRGYATAGAGEERWAAS